MSIFSKHIDKRIAAYQRELIETHYQEVETMYKQIRGWRHDYRNHIYGENVFDPEGRVIMKQMADLLGVRFQPLFIRLRQFGLLDYHPLEELLMNQILESEVYA